MADSATSVRHVIHQDGYSISHIPDQNHAIHFIGLLPLFVDEGKVYIQPVCYGRDPANEKMSVQAKQHMQTQSPRTQFVSVRVK